MSLFAAQNGNTEEVALWETVPSKPTGLGYTSVDANEIDLIWDLNDPIENVTEYRITIQSYDNPANYNDGTVQPFTVGHYTANTNLSIWITAVNSYGESVQSDEINVMSPP